MVIQSRTCWWNNICIFGYFNQINFCYDYHILILVLTKLLLHLKCMYLNWPKEMYMLVKDTIQEYTQLLLIIYSTLHVYIIISVMRLYYIKVRWFNIGLSAKQEWKWNFIWNFIYFIYLEPELLITEMSYYMAHPSIAYICFWAYVHLCKATDLMSLHK